MTIFFAAQLLQTIFSKLNKKIERSKFKKDYGNALLTSCSNLLKRTSELKDSQQISNYCEIMNLLMKNFCKLEQICEFKNTNLSGEKIWYTLAAKMNSLKQTKMSLKYLNVLSKKLKSKFPFLVGVTKEKGDLLTSKEDSLSLSPSLCKDSSLCLLIFKAQVAFCSALPSSASAWNVRFSLTFCFFNAETKKKQELLEWTHRCDQLFEKDSPEMIEEFNLQLLSLICNFQKCLSSKNSKFESSAQMIVSFFTHKLCSFKEEGSSKLCLKDQIKSLTCLLLLSLYASYLLEFVPISSSSLPQLSQTLSDCCKNLQLLSKQTTTTLLASKGKSESVPAFVQKILFCLHKLKLVLLKQLNPISSTPSNPKSNKLFSLSSLLLFNSFDFLSKVSSKFKVSNFLHLFLALSYLFFLSFFFFG